jgi:nitroimidazol reductase NimA-like FMN-containing flavoprotein (pyridoxamine 5'-phosphate oxidase superfamily)
MVIDEMTQEECFALLLRTQVARLACARNNQPYIVPIHVDFEDGYLYGFATAGQKIEWMRQNPLVCVEIDELATQTNWVSVVVMGSYEELPPTEESADARMIAERLFQKHPMWWEPASVLLASDESRRLVVFRIRINRVTGRRARPNTPRTPVHTEASAPTVTRTRWFIQRLRVSWQRREDD